MLGVEPRGGRAIPPPPLLGSAGSGERGGRVSEVAMRGSEGTVAERIEAGRARRELAPRASHADYSPSPSRPDPIEILQDEAKDRLPDLLPIRYGRMASSPFAFLRGSAVVM